MHRPGIARLIGSIITLNGTTIEEVERRHIAETLKLTGWNKQRAADLLGIGRYSLYRKAKRLGIPLDGE